MIRLILILLLITSVISCKKEPELPQQVGTWICIDSWDETYVNGFVTFTETNLKSTNTILGVYDDEYLYTNSIIYLINYPTTDKEPKAYMEFVGEYLYLYRLSSLDECDNSKWSKYEKQ